MKVRFWGVRGSIAVSSPEYVHTGGNTPCVEVLHEGARLILDGGTGLRRLGASIGPRPAEATLLFSHIHWDHIQGVPFFGPAFHPKSKLTFGGPRSEWGTLRDFLDAQMHPPTFPVTLAAFGADLDFIDVVPGRPFTTGPFRVTPVTLHHPDGVVAYRVEAGGRSMVYATDNEHGGRIDPALVELARGADLLIHDAQYTDEEYAGGPSGPPRKGWGHSTWTEAVEAARRACVGALALFHHDPERDDVAVGRIEKEAQKCFAGAFAAREGLVVGL